MTSSWLWLPLAVLSAFFAALIAVFGKLGLAKVDTTVATMLRATIMFVVLFGAVVATGKFPQVGGVQGKALLFIVLAGASGALSWLLYFWALKLGKASQVAPIDRLSAVFAVALAFLFLGETVGWKGWLGAALITVGAVLTALP